MSLTSASTITDALDQYKDNLNWEGSVTTAQNALEAVRFILAIRPKIIATGDQNINFESLQQEKQKLEDFVGKLGSGVNRSSFTRGRMLT
jgi:hypothetical protein